MTTNANLMIMLSFIISGHPDWKKSKIKIFEVCKPEQYDEIVANQEEAWLREGRLPITEKNIEIIVEERKRFNQRSCERKIKGCSSYTDRFQG